MSKGKHTPAPWTWFTEHDKNGNRIQDPLSGRMKFLRGSDGQGFAHTVGLDPETDLANARLIAAAPLLLEALEELSDWYFKATGLPAAKANNAISEAKGGV